MIAAFHIPRGIEFYDAALEGLARVDTLLYKERRLPSIYAGGVRYQREVRTENWRTVNDVLATGYGDCEDLACARVGELRAKGDRRACAFASRSGPKMVHIKVRRGDGVIEDPSLKLGMGSEGGVIIMGANDDYSSGDEEEIGADLSTSAEVTWQIERFGNGWRGVVRVPLHQGKALVVKRGGKTQADAGKAALDVAARVLDNPAVAAVVPGPARFALNLVRSPKARDLAKSVLKLF